MMAVTTHEPVLSRLDRLDNLLRNLEEIRVGNRSTRSSSPSTPSSLSRLSDGHTSSLDFSPRSRGDKFQCRSINDAIHETEHKGTVLDRVSIMEDRLLKVCSQLEEEIDAEKHERQERTHQDETQTESPKKGLKQLVKSCVKGKAKGKSKKKV